MSALKSNVIAGFCAIFLSVTIFVGHICAAEPQPGPSDLPRIAPTEPANALSTFRIKNGFRLDLVAAEPLVTDPIAICFDENSRLFVVEMRDYSERRDERLGRIRLLEDTDGDGRMDESTVFAEDLPWPTALFWYGGGLYVVSTPDLLYFRDLDGDGKADERRVVFTGFGTQVSRLNVQQLPNSLTWTLDNRIHGASGGNGGLIRCPERPERSPLQLRNSDFSFNPRSLELRRESGGGQHGLTFDHAGRKFICSNSAHIRQVMYEHRFVLENMLHGLPAPAIDIPVDGPSAEVFRISPDEPWRVLRTRWRVAGLVGGPIEGGGRPSGYFTSATGVTIYRGDALGSDFVGDAFIADVGSNLVHRKKLRPNGVAFQAERPDDEKGIEFLASTDRWFRPVDFANAPDGALYVVDMYREVIEHPWSIPQSIKEHLDLNSGNDRGRIYRVVPENFEQRTLPRLGHAKTEELVALLSDANGWKRDNAARLIYERQDRSVVAPLRELLLESGSSLAQIHALYALSGLGALREEDLLIAAAAPVAEVRENSLRLMLDHPPESETLLDRVEQMAADPAPRVRFQLAWTLAAITHPNKPAILSRMAGKRSDAWERHAILAAQSIRKTEQSKFKTGTVPVPSKVVSAAHSVAPRDDVIAEYASALHLRGDAQQGRKIYLERCASCHRLSGEGSVVGPDLESVRAAGKELILQNIVDPNREVPPQFAAYEIETEDGELLTGILTQEAANGTTIRQANGQDLFVPKARIQASRRSDISLMPEGLETGLTPQAMADLLSYISSE